ncbi:MAG: VOC family protein [Actinomycetes bacterium]
MRPRIEVGIDATDPVRLAPFWLAALGYQRTRGDAHPYLDLVGPPGALPVFLQHVSEPKVAKNRLHLDLFTTDPQALVDRLVGLGARRVGEPIGAPTDWSWQVLADPEGNEFCVCREEP